MIVEPGYFKTNLGDSRREFGVDGPPYDELRTLTMEMANRLGRGDAPGPELVARAIADAIESDAPALRIPVGEMAEMVMAARGSMHDAAFEAAMRATLDLTW